MSPFIQPLESRRLLSAASVKLSGSTLSIRGSTDVANSISVVLSTSFPDTGLPQQNVRIIVNGVEQTFPASAVRSLKIFGGSKVANSISTTIDVRTTITGGKLADTITVGNAKSNIRSLAGNDTIFTGDGANTIDSGTGNDSVTAGNGKNLIRLQAGDDTLISGAGANRVFGGAGNDTITTGSSATTGKNFVQGDAGNDTITTGAGADRIRGNNGNDALHGGGGNDSLNGGSGDDLVDGGSGSNSIVGTAGKDTLTASPASTSERNAYRTNSKTTISPAPRNNIDTVKRAGSDSGGIGFKPPGGFGF